MTSPVEKNFGPVCEITMYQARCTSCGNVYETGDTIVAWSEYIVAIEHATDWGEWFGVWSGGTITALLCPACQHCEVCGAGRAYEIDGHLVCEDHEDNDFSASVAG